MVSVHVGRERERSRDTERDPREKGSGGIFTSHDKLTRNLLLVFAGITSVALLIASIALLIWVNDSGGREERRGSGSNDGATAVHDSWLTPSTSPVNGTGPRATTATEVIKPSGAGGGKRFTLRLGQGYRFKDGVVVVKPDDQPDLVFKYLPPVVGGLALRYNPLSQQLETKMEPTLTSPVPLLLSAHIGTFDAKPNVAMITSGDIAAYDHQAPIGPKTRYLLLQTQGSDQYLLMLDELEAVPGKYDDWRIGFSYEKVQLPMGLAGGKINKPLPGKMIYRDWIRSKMIVRVDLTSGKEEAIADGSVPSAAGDRLFAYADTTGAYVVREAASGGKVVATIRFNERVQEPLISPDGTRMVGTVYRAGPETKIGVTTLAGAQLLSVGVFDLGGRELASFPGYDDAAWTPDGKLIATGKYTDPGLFEIDPATKKVTPIDATIASPANPAVSPDGKTIAFVTGSRVWLIGRDGKDLRQLFPDGRIQQRPVFSPDGTKIAFVICNQVLNDSTGDLFVMDPRTQEITALRTGAGLSLQPEPATRVSWMP